jgi:2-oxoisovalerate dehydrogenase E1 component
MNINISHKIIKDLIRIRNIEQAFLDLFSQGKLNGTVHTCIGQELSALAFAGQINKSDFVFSNHRCHGHFIAYTKDWKSLILELMGKKNGVCAGIGSSQHLQQNNFFSNGIQGGIMPMAAGFALGNKINKSNNIGIVYIGDGTLGEGVVYETLNFISKKKIPLIVVCENNLYAQSTPIEYNLAGSIKNRALAFDIEFRESSTFSNNLDILEEAKKSIDYVRETGFPIFHLVNTYRLKAHSKGDDDRDKNEIKEYEKKDIIDLVRKNDTKYIDQISEQINNEIWNFIKEVENEEELDLNEYLKFENENDIKLNYSVYKPSKERVIFDLNQTFQNIMENQNVVLLGEDIIDPYGGAFKVTKGLSTKFPDRVIGTSISEGLIAGLANGLALNGFKPYAEFMFGDFTALAFDQFLNHSSKVYNMYNKKITCPVVFRTPMGGKRGYGPTHSQSIEKHFVGMDTFEIVALNKFLNPSIIYKYVHERKHPTLVIENKVDYAQKANLNLPEGYNLYITNEELPNLIIKPNDNSIVTTSVITYGGSVDMVIELIEKIFFEHDELIQILILTKIDPLPEKFILSNIQDYTNIITFEEGTQRGTIGNNIISLLAQKKKNLNFSSISSLDTTIPSAKTLEKNVLVNQQMLLDKVKILNNNVIN